jgi:Sortilin, neurotensin receptor 3,
MSHLYVATNGLSVWSSGDLGETLLRMSTGTGMYSGSQVWALALHPSLLHVLLAGTNTGIYRLDQEEENWTHIPSPTDDAMLVTALAYAPDNPDVILAGTQPAGLYRSEDGGKSWQNLEVPMKPYALTGYYMGDKPFPEGHPGAYGRKHWTRVTQIVFDSTDSSLAWAGVEIDGAWRSRDGGRRWERSDQGFKSRDIHGFAVVCNGGRILFATTDAGLHISRDDGKSWTMQPIDSAWQYTRSIVERPDKTGVMFMTNGDGPPGTSGRLFRSRNYGLNWEDARLPGEVQSSAYFLAANPADPQLIYAAATLGQIYRSTDGGENWTALKRRLGEIRALAWLPD